MSEATQKPLLLQLLEHLQTFLAGCFTNQQLRDAGAGPAALAGAMTAHLDLGTGYSVAADRAAAAALLRAACDAAIANPAWRPGQPRHDDTHCNGGAAEIAAAAAGYHDLADKKADQQIQTIRQDPAWREDTMERFSVHAQRGGLGFATLEEYPHGHLAAGYPDPMEPSDTWGGDLVAIIANVGHENKRCRLSGGFLAAQRPMIRFYLFKPEEAA